jgi:release factor glutamine methyltransferase
MRLRELAAAAERRLVAAGIAAAEARLDAELLLRDVLGWDRAAWLTRRDEAVPDGVESAFGATVRRREAREPVAYIRGVQAFYGRDYAIGPGVLIPRPESELIVEESLAALAGRSAPHLLDIGTGSGCLAVTLALEIPDATVTATDVSAEALAVAGENARRFGVGARVSFALVAGTGGGGPYDLIVSNPPYVPDGDRPGLQPEVAHYEPATALFAGLDGLDVVRVMVPEVRTRLTPGGAFVMEIGIGQSEAALAIAREAGFAHVGVRADFQGIPRVVVARA